MSTKYVPQQTDLCGPPSSFLDQLPGRYNSKENIDSFIGLWTWDPSEFERAQRLRALRELCHSNVPAALRYSFAVSLQC